MAWAAEAVVHVGNSSGRDLDKLAAFGLTAVPATRVKAPLVRECYASFESKLVDARLIRAASAPDGELLRHGVESFED